MVIYIPFINSYIANRTQSDNPSGQADHTTDLGRRHATGPKARKAGVAIALRELAALIVRQQPVVVVGRLRQPKQDLQQAMDGGCGFEIAAADDVGDALPSIVDNDGQMVAGRALLALNDDVTPDRRTLCLNAGLHGLVEDVRGQWHSSQSARCQRDGFGHIEAHGEGLAGGFSARNCNGGQIAAEAWVDRSAVGVDMAGAGCGFDFLARGEAGVEEAHGGQAAGGCLINGEMLGLAKNGAV